LPLLHSDKAFEYYLQALLKANKEASINPAVRRRESLLASHPLVTPSSPAPLAEPESSGVTSASPQEVSPTPPQSVSRSQQIASSVIAGATVEPPSSPGSPGQLSPDMARLLAAINAGQGASGNPVHVIIKERES